MRACGTPAKAASNSAARAGRTSHRNRVFDSANSSTTLGQIAFPRHVAQGQPRAQAAGEGHFGGGRGQPAFAQVVAGADQPGIDGPVQGREALQGLLGLDPRRLAAGERFDQGEVRAAHLVARQADLVQIVAGLLQVHRDAMAHVVDLSQGADQAATAEWRSARASLGRNSLLRLSLPLMNGVPSAVATS